ncbi:hypothetical protein DMC47_05155 [Nostoc sp. 3335mG]|nr:hypothetical protein DMC47_05155 [Nostoc sp. 3335mG]
MAAAPEDYSRLQIILHWVIAGLILIQLTVNRDMQQAFAQRLANDSLPENAGAFFHAAIGILALALALLRLLIRSRRGVPAPHSEEPLIVFVSHATHLLLYGFLFFMPITGTLAWFTGIELAAVLHELGRLILIPAILLHVGGAVVEQFVMGNPVFQRMFGSRSD